MNKSILAESNRNTLCTKETRFVEESVRWWTKGRGSFQTHSETVRWWTKGRRSFQSHSESVWQCGGPVVRCGAVGEVGAIMRL